jgi:hypothetical protein
MMACTSDGLVPNVGGISEASTTPKRPLVPAPTKMTRPPFRSYALPLLVNRGDDFLVLVHDHLDDVGDGDLVD